MRRTLFLLILMTATAATAQSAAAPAKAAASPAPANWPTAQFASSKDSSVQKARQVLNDMIRALGGDTYLNAQDSKTEGRAYSFYHGQPNSMGLEFWRFWQWPDKDRWEFTKQRDVVELNIGDKGYEITYKGTATQDPKQLEEYLRHRDHSLDWVVRKWLPATGTMILYEGTAMVEQNLADQVTVLNANNDSVTISVEPRTHLPVRIKVSFRDPMDRQMDEELEVFGNYRLVQGIQTPFSIVRYHNGDMSAQRFITSVSYNNNLPASMFEVPSAIYNQPKTPTPK